MICIAGTGFKRTHPHHKQGLICNNLSTISPTTKTMKLILKSFKFLYMFSLVKSINVTSGKYMCNKHFNSLIQCNSVNHYCVLDKKVHRVLLFSMEALQFNGLVKISGNVSLTFLQCTPVWPYILFLVDKYHSDNFTSQ